MQKHLVGPLIMMASFVLAGAWPAAADLAPSAPRPAAQVQMAEASSSAAVERGAYTQKAREEMQQWRVKLDQFGESAKAGSNDARKAASQDLDAAWAKTKEASARLETAGEADWEMAKVSFKNASDALTATWTKARATVK